jgi:hypothetical protein
VISKGANIAIQIKSLCYVVTVQSPYRFEPLTPTLSLRERGFEEGGLNGYAM